MSGEGFALYIGPATVRRIQAWTQASGHTVGIPARAVQLIVKRRGRQAKVRRR